MAINPISNNMNIIAALPDEPNVDGGLTPAQLKAEFDKAGNIIKTYINSSLISDIDNSIATGGIAVGGEYSPIAIYQPRTLVTYLGDVFITLQVVTGVTPTDDNVNYSLLIAAPVMDLGNNANQAFQGDLGLIAYVHSQIVTGNPHGTLPSDIGAVPDTRTVQGYPLSSNVTLSYFDVGASPVAHPHGNINNAGYMGSTVNLPIMTGTGGILETRSAANFRAILGLGFLTTELPIANGGTGQNSVANARNALGLGLTANELPIANGGTGQNSISNMRSVFGLGATSGAVPVTNGGTGATTAAAALTNLGITFGTSDLTANVSALTSGSFYFVYV
jgi:hypothetical protein